MTHSAFVAERAMEFIRTHRQRSWLCVAGFYPPHDPWLAPKEFLDRYDPDTLPLPEFPAELEARRSATHFSDDELRSARHGYYAMVSEVDHHVGRIVGQLDELGLAEETLVVFTSDHGEWLGEHLRYGKGHPAHDAVSRVPLVLRWPGRVRRPGRTESELVEAVDLVPTLLDAVGLPLPGHLQGTSLYPALVDAPWERRGSALTEHAGWKPLRTAEHRYVVHADGGELLFDLTRDPHGYEDIGGRPDAAPVLAGLRRRLLTRLLAMERPLPRVWPY